MPSVLKYRKNMELQCDMDKENKKRTFNVIGNMAPLFEASLIFLLLYNTFSTYKRESTSSLYTRKDTKIFKECTKLKA